MMFSIIGETYIHEDDKVLVGDPSVCATNIDLYDIAVANQQMVTVSGLVAGSYMAYHTSNLEHPLVPKFLVLLHKDFSPEEALEEEKVGEVHLQFSGRVFVCRKDAAFHAQYAYYVLEADAMYDAEAIIRLIETEYAGGDYLELLDLCRRNLADGYVSGEDILKICDSGDIPEFLPKILSNHWSVRVNNLLEEAPAVPVIGGVASNATKESCEVSLLYHIASMKPVGIQVQLFCEY